MASIRLTHHFSTIGFIRIFNTSKLGQCTTIKNVTDVYCFFFEYSTISRAIRLDRKKSGFVYLLFLTFSKIFTYGFHKLAATFVRNIVIPHIKTILRFK